MKTKRKVAFRKKKQQNKFGMILVSLAMIMLLVAVGFKSITLRAKQLEYMEQEAILMQQIQEEEARKEDLQEFEKYTKTKKYAEEVAKEKLGLVYEDEIIFKYED